ncbi:MAG TPA: hypothetical protein VLB47_01465, partial [Solirubrobacteraceae bacterium]|nr:hypothetical protein [Solirubrobacteraceae bacterium]
MDELYRFVQLRPTQLGRIDDRILIRAWSDPRTDLHGRLAEIRAAGGDGQETARAFLADTAQTDPVRPLLRLHGRVEDSSSLSGEEFARLVRGEFERPEPLTESRRTAGDMLIAVALLPEIDAPDREAAHRLVVLGAIAQRYGFDRIDPDERRDDTREVLHRAMAILPADLFPARVGGMVFPIRDAPGGREAERSIHALLGDGAPVPAFDRDVEPHDGDGHHVADRDGHHDEEDARRLALRELIALVHDPELELEPVGAVDEAPDAVGPRLRPLDPGTLPRMRLTLTDRALDRLSESTRDLLAHEAPGA